MKHRSLPQGERGAELLLAHCAPLTDADLSRPPAFLRLEQALGGELARLLVGALATQTRRPAGRAACLGLLVLAVDAHAEKERAEGDQSDDRRRSLVDPDREHEGPDVERRGRAPRETP